MKIIREDTCICALGWR